MDVGDRRYIFVIMWNMVVECGGDVTGLIVNVTIVIFLEC